MHAIIPKGNIGYDQYTVPYTVDCQTLFSCFPLALANIHQWSLVPFFQISLKFGDLGAHSSEMSIMGGAFIQHRLAMNTLETS